MFKVLQQITLISIFFISSCGTSNTTRVLIDQGAQIDRADAYTRQVLTREVHTVSLGIKANVVCAISNTSSTNRAYATDPNDADASWSGRGTAENVRIFADKHIFEEMVAQISATNDAETVNLPMKEVSLVSLPTAAKTCGWRSREPVYKAFGFEDSKDGSFNDVQIIFAIDGT